jgi:hypothetical protein
MASCSGQPKVFGESPINLENFDFNLNVKKFYPEANKYRAIYVPITQAIQIYDVELDNLGSILIMKETVREGWREDSEPKWIEYKQQGCNNYQKLAVFGKYTFSCVDMVTTVDNQVMVIGAYDFYGTEENAMNFIKLLNKKYGKNIQTKKNVFSRDFNIYTWELKDRIIKYCFVSPDDRGTLTVVLGEQNEETEEEEEMEAYFYIIKKEYADKVIGNLNTDNLIYCK